MQTGSAEKGTLKFTHIWNCPLTHRFDSSSASTVRSGRALAEGLSACTEFVLETHSERMIENGNELCRRYGASVDGGAGESWPCCGAVISSYVLRCQPTGCEPGPSSGLWAGTLASAFSIPQTLLEKRQNLAVILAWKPVWPTPKHDATSTAHHHSVHSCFPAKILLLFFKLQATEINVCSPWLGIVKVAVQRQLWGICGKGLNTKQSDTTWHSICRKPEGSGEMGEAQAMRAMPEEEFLHSSLFFFFCSATYRVWSRQAVRGGDGFNLSGCDPVCAMSCQLRSRLGVEESRAGSSGQQGLIQPAVQICSVNPVGSIPQPH